MQITSSNDLPNPTAATKKVDFSSQIVKSVLELSLKLATELDNLSPGHRFGFGKYYHMCELSKEAERWGELQGLNLHDTGLLKILLAGHDLGRHEEEILKRLPENERQLRYPGEKIPSHSTLSAFVLEKSGLLAPLNAEDRELILDAVKYHGEKDVPLSGRAKDFCYHLRDVDKLELLSAERFTEPRGVLEQIETHFLSEQERLRINEDTTLKMECLEIVSAALEGSESQLPSDPISEKVYTAMNLSPPPNQEAILAIMDRRQAELFNCKHCWCSYMMVHVAFIFDIYSKFAMQEVNEKHLLDSRLEFISRHTDDDTFKAINEAIRKYHSEER